MNIFLCGALSDAPLAALVLGPDTGACTEAVLSDHRPVQVAGGDLAVAAPAAGRTTPGTLYPDLPEAARARLTYYLDVFGVMLAPVTIAGQPALAPAAEDPGGADWSQAEWRAHRAGKTRWAAQEIMAHRHSYGAGGLAQRLAPILSRAELWDRAQALPPEPGHDPDTDVIVHALHQPYLNFFSVREMDLQFRKQDGTMSAVVNRGAMMLGEASGVLPYDPVTDQVLLIQQFRAPLFIGGSNSPWAWEPVAGLVDPGETPEETAHREAMEEAGLTLWHLELLGPTHASPGVLSDRLHLFVGLTDLSHMVDAVGVESEGEDIRREVLGFDTFIDGIDRQKYSILPVIALGHYLARHRDRLRAMA